MANITLSYAPYTDALGSPPTIEACGAATPAHWRTVFASTLASPLTPLSAFQPLNLAAYYQGPLLTRAIPGLAFTGVVLAACLAFLTWRAARAGCGCCCARARRRARLARWAGLDGAAAAASAPRRVLGSRTHKVLIWLGMAGSVLALAAAAYGVAQAEPRGLDSALEALRGDTPAAVRGLLVNATAQMAEVGAALNQVAVAVASMAASAGETAGNVSLAPATTDAAALVADEATALVADLRATVDDVASISNSLADSLVGGLDKAVDRFLPLARRVDAGRLGLIYGIFGLLILSLSCAALAAAAGVPAGLAGAVGVSLFLAALVAVLAIPLLGLTVAAGADACAYAEPLILAVAVRADGDGGLAAPILASILYGPAARQDLRDWLALQGMGGGDGGPLVASAPSLTSSLRSWSKNSTTKVATASLADTTEDALGLGLADLATAADAAGADLLDFAGLYNQTVAAPASDAAAFQAAVEAASRALNATADRITALDATLSPASLRAVYTRVKGVLCCVVADGVGDLWWSAALAAGATTLLAAAPLGAVLARLDGLPPLPQHRHRRYCWCSGGWDRRRAGENEGGEGGGVVGPPHTPLPAPRGVPAGALTAAGYTAAVALPPGGQGGGLFVGPPLDATLSPQGSGVPLVRAAQPSAPPLMGGGGSPVIVPPAAWPVRPAGHSSAPPPHWAKYPKI